MMKRIIGSLLMMVTVVASLSMFVSCKDYDDDINDLRNQISSTSSDLNSLVENKVSTVESEISSLQSQLSSLESAYKAADENLQKAIDDALENAKKYADDSAAAAEQAAKDYADIQAAQAQEAAIAAAKELIEEAVAELQSQLDAANKTLEEYGTSILGLIEADAQLQVGIDEAVALANAAQEAAETAQAAAEAAQDTANQALAAAQAAQQAADNAQSAADAAQSTANANSKSIEELQETVKGLQDEIDALKQVDEGLQSSINSLQSQINVLNTTVEAVVSQAAENKANIEKVYLYLKGLSDANAEAIEELNGKYAALEKLVNDNQEAIEKELSEAVEQLEGEIASALAEAKAYALIVAYQAAGDLYDALLDGEFADIYGQLTDINGNIVDIKGLIAGLTTDVGNLQIAIQAVEDAYKKAIEEVYKYVDEADALLQSQIDALNDAIKELRNSIEDLDVDKLEKRVSTLEEQISELESEIAGIEAAIEELQDYTNGLDAAIVSLQNVVSGQAKQIDVIFEELANINKYLGVLGKRLTSLVFAPTTYVDGIEAIKFATLSYTSWEDLTADEPDGSEYTINEALYTVEYLVSPSHLDINSIASLSYISNVAENVSTRAASNDAPIEVASYEYAENENGVNTLQLQLKKTDTEYNLAEGEFVIVSLKANIADAYLLDDEIASGEEVAVYSDWTRLYEVHVTPYIHNTQYVDGNDKLDEGEGGSPEHFFDWTEIHTNNAGSVVSALQDHPLTYGHTEEWSVDNFAYTGTYDLSQLVKIDDEEIVCDKDGNTYKASTYGLEFKYELIEFWCYELDHEASDNGRSSMQDQSTFFGIQEDGTTLYVLPAVSGDTGSASRLAVNKLAPIRVTLIDTNNDDAVVDVRYFFIKCLDEEAFYDMGDLLDYETEFTDCGEEYTATVTVEEIQAKCGVVDAEAGVDMPITYEELTGNYSLLADLWASHEDAKTVGTTDPETGDPTEAAPDSDLGTVALDDDGNIIWTITPAFTQEDYDAGEKVVEAWGVYQSKTLESNIIPFKLTMTITLPKMTRIAGHNEPYWAVTSGENTHSGNATDSIRIMNPALETDAVYGSSNYETTQMLGDLLTGYMIDGRIPSSWPSIVNSCNEAHVVFDERYFGALSEAINETYGWTEDDPEYLTADNWSTTPSGQSLLLNGVRVAQVVWDQSTLSSNIMLDETDNGSATSVPVEGAELLVGQYIPLLFYAQTCDWYQVVDQYFVYFMEPLTVEKGKVIDIDLYDVTAGGSTASLDGTIELWEEFTTNKRPVWDNKPVGESKTDASLVAWYGVEKPVYDVDNALTNLTTSGTVGTTFEHKLSEFTNKKGEQAYYIYYLEDTNEIVYYNNNNDAISNSFEVIVPVTIQTKWQKLTALEVHITIHPAWEDPDYGTNPE